MLDVVREWLRTWLGTTRQEAPTFESTSPSIPLQPLRQIRLTDGVSRTLFEEYQAHRNSDRGDEETGWVLLGHREGDEAVALATLPAGANRQAGQAHVRFNSSAQALASRIVRQADKRLTLIGVVHTHPGSLRHPSDGDFRGDARWVAHLRGQEGVFAIGTADAAPGSDPGVADHPRANRQTLGKLCWSWYALASGDRKYRPLPVELTIGPDLARDLRPVWDVIEQYADRLDRLARQQMRVMFDVVDGPERALLAVTVPLADNSAIRILVGGKAARFFVFRDGDLVAADLPDVPPDQGLYMLLAELAARN